MELDAHRKHREIVIVDNASHLVAVYEKFFATAGLKVIAKFSTAKETLSNFGSNSKVLADSIVLLDNRLQGTGGADVAIQLKELNPRQKIVLLTAEDLSHFDAEQKLFDAIIQKPFTVSELLAAIEEASSILREKGSWIFEDPEEIKRLVYDIESDSKEKLCSVRNSNSIGQRLSIPERNSSFISARTKGLEVFLITEVTRDNLFYCKELIMNRGVKLRHLVDAQSTFAVWDKRHTIEVVLGRGESHSAGQVTYSNLEQIVSRNQYLIDHLWNIATPADQKIKELETNLEEASVKVVSGIAEIDPARDNLIRNARSYIVCCIIPKWLQYVLRPQQLEVRAEAISRGIRFLMLTEITMESLSSCEELLEIGVEIRHLPNLKGAFMLNEKECMTTALEENPKINQSYTVICTNYTNFVEQHKSIFDSLWNIATPASARMKEIEEEKKIKNA
ncbi:MAG: response regulator [Nitrososphaerales archaeon]